MNTECIFCKIIHNLVSSTIIDQTDELIVIKDIAPQAPIHYLIIPKKHCKDLKDVVDSDQQMLGSLLLMAKKLSKKLSGNQEFKIVINNGSSVGQSVFHLHVHFLAGNAQRHL